MSSQKREIRRAAARLANLGKVVVVTESQDERLRAAVQTLRTEDTYEAAAACPACRTAQEASGDASALCQQHLAKALGL
jgi:hypothetical protein